MHGTKIPRFSPPFLDKIFISENYAKIKFSTRLYQIALLDAVVNDD